MRWESFSYIQSPEPYSLSQQYTAHGIREARCRSGKMGKRWLASDIDRDTATQLVRAHNKALKEAKAT